MWLFYDRFNNKNLNSIIRVIASLHLTYSVYYDARYVSFPTTIIPVAMQYGWKFKYLTFWNECIESIYFCISVVDDVFLRNSDTEKTPLKTFRDYLFTVIVFPLSMFVAATFWILYGIDRELVLPKVVDPYFPVWLNHSVHTFIIVYSILEMVTSYHRSFTVSKSLAGLWSLTTIYLGWVHVVYYKSGIWVYPILSKLSLPYRIGFFATSLAGITVFYVIGKYVNDGIWKKRIQKKSLQIN